MMTIITPYICYSNDVSRKEHRDSFETLRHVPIVNEVSWPGDSRVTRVIIYFLDIIFHLVLLEGNQKWHLLFNSLFTFICNKEDFFNLLSEISNASMVWQISLIKVHVFFSWCLRSAEVIYMYCSHAECSQAHI